MIESTVEDAFGHLSHLQRKAITHSLRLYGNGDLTFSSATKEAMIEGFKTAVRRKDKSAASLVEVGEFLWNVYEYASASSAER